MGQIRISVIIPVFNAARWLREAVESVALRSSTSVRYETEILAIDDASTDTSWQVIEELQREGLIQRSGKLVENRGPAAARNEALRQATGEFFAFLDADDVRVEGSLVRQAERLAARPEIDAIIGRTQIQRLQPGTSAFLDQGRPVLLLYLPSGLFRRELFFAQRCGFFDENYRVADDVDWFLRARENRVNFWLEHDVASRYRRHGANLTTDTNWYPSLDQSRQSASQREVFSAVRESLRRRRADRLLAAPLPPWNGIAE
jgi:glycosyltransferase involved in cell wall biosynthesis